MVRYSIIRVPFETPLHWIIQIGLSTDFRYMTCRVRGTHGLYAMPSSRCPATLHWPHAATLPPVVLLQVRSVVLAPLLLPGDQPNGIVASTSAVIPFRPIFRRRYISRALFGSRSTRPRYDGRSRRESPDDRIAELNARRYSRMVADKTGIIVE